MARLKLRVSDLCWRCDSDKGTFKHMLYGCQMTRDLWNNIILFLNRVLGTKMIQNPALCILGIIPEGIGLTGHQVVWCRLALITGCRIVLRHWKAKNAIPFNEWCGEMTKIANYEQLIFKLNNKLEIFWKIWGPYLNLILKD